MSEGLSCTFCDGETLHVFPARVEVFDNGFLRLTGENFQLFAAGTTVAVTERLGELPYFLTLPEGGVIELPSSVFADDLVASLRPPKHLSRALHWLETRAAIAAAATFFLFASVSILLWQGLPRLAKHVAYHVPASIEAQAGRVGYSILARALLPSELDAYSKRRLRQALERLEKARPLHVEPQLKTLRLGAPNAFALPGGVLVVSDELVNLASNDDELTAVLAHEIGHVECRHGMQSILRNSSSLLAVSTVTGDLSTLSTFSGTLPFLLLEYGYARDFEREADAYAVDLLRDAHVDPNALGAVLRRLEKNNPRRERDFSYLNTHPSNEERLRLLREKIGDKAK